MKTGILNDTKKTVKDMAKQAAKQVVSEPFEILKKAGEQVAGIENNENSLDKENQQLPLEQNGASQGEQILKQKLEVQGQRQIQALETEIKDIQKEKEVEKEKGKITEEQQKQARVQEKPSLIEPSSKQSRNIFAGMKKKTSGFLGVQRQQRQTETAKSPTG